MANTKTENSVNLFLGGCNCAQAIVKGFSELTENETELLMKVAQPFGGGIARTGTLCGAVSGALMTIGVKYSNPDLPESKALVQTLSAKFLTAFKEANSALNCKDLLGYDIGTEEGKKSISELNLREKICKNLIFSSAEILNSIIAEQEN